MNTSFPLKINGRQAPATNIHHFAVTKNGQQTPFIATTTPASDLIFVSRLWDYEVRLNMYTLKSNLKSRKKFYTIWFYLGNLLKQFIRLRHLNRTVEKLGFSVLLITSIKTYMKIDVIPDCSKLSIIRPRLFEKLHKSRISSARLETAWFLTLLCIQYWIDLGLKPSVLTVTS